LQQVRVSPVWSADLAFLEGNCRLHEADAAGALAAYQEASALGRDDVVLVIALAEARWPEPAEEGLTRWLELPFPTQSALQLAASRGWWRGDDAQVDRALDEARFWADRVSADSGLVYWVYLMDGLRWLALDEPGLAERALAKAARARPNDRRAPTWRAEALRRLGDLAQAELVFGRALFLNVEAPPWQAAVQARIAVDLGDLPRARDLLGARWEDLDLLASAWYLAQAEGSLDQASLAARWGSAAGRPPRDLDVLRPEAGR
jgi:tetratricopeptide (TPR) repeat protein